MFLSTHDHQSINQSPQIPLLVVVPQLLLVPFLLPLSIGGAVAEIIVGAGDAISLSSVRVWLAALLLWLLLL
jgi:hypothetical protein